jgi:oxaloacetate decarboxylase gamma subunit
VHETSLLLEGVKLMLLGMGVVFAFLMALVLAMHGMSRLAARLEARRGTARPAPDAELAAAIAAAVARYRAGR